MKCSPKFVSSAEPPSLSFLYMLMCSFKGAQHVSLQTFGGVLEWTIRPVLKTGVLHGTVGSNPTPSAISAMGRDAENKISLQTHMTKPRKFNPDSMYGLSDPVHQFQTPSLHSRFTLAFICQARENDGELLLYSPIFRCFPAKSFCTRRIPA